MFSVEPFNSSDGKWGRNNWSHLSTLMTNLKTNAIDIQQIQSPSDYNNQPQYCPNGEACWGDTNRPSCCSYLAQGDFMLWYPANENFMSSDILWG